MGELKRSVVAVEVPGVTSNEEGIVGLHGAALRLFHALDRAFQAIAAALAADPWMFNPMLSVEDLKRIDYFASFPHLVNVPVAVDRGEDSQRSFRCLNGSTAKGPLKLGKLAAAPAVLSPAACYSVAFGVERWVYAIAQRHGPDEANWPKL